MQWIELLEVERNKADYLGSFPAFKKLSLGISATIGGKYGISSRPATPEERIALSYSIIRTRHKFRGKRNMLTDFYGVGVATGTPHAQSHLATILAIDTMATKAMEDEDFSNQWAAIKQEPPIAEAFIDSVKSYATTQEKESLVKALDKPLNDLFRMDKSIIAIAKEVLDIFAPKITLGKIFTEMIGGEYQGWTVHGADNFAYLIVLHPEDKERFSFLTEKMLRGIFNQNLAEFSNEDVLCCSSVANLISVENASGISDEVALHYVFELCFDAFASELDGWPKHSISGQKHLTLTRHISQRLTKILAKPYNCAPEEKLLNIYRHRAQFVKKLLHGGYYLEDISFLIACGDNKAVYLYAALLFESGNSIEENIEPAVELFKEAIDLGDEASTKDLPDYLTYYSVSLFDGSNGIERDIPKAIEICREAIRLGSEQAKRNLLSFLNKYAFMLISGKTGVAKNILKAIETCREAVVLGSKWAQNNLPKMLNEYACHLWNGREGLTKDCIKAIEICREAAALGSETARHDLPIMLAAIQ